MSVMEHARRVCRALALEAVDAISRDQQNYMVDALGRRGMDRQSVERIPERLVRLDRHIFHPQLHPARSAQHIEVAEAVALRTHLEADWGADLDLRVGPRTECNG